MSEILYCPLCGSILNKTEWGHSCSLDGFFLPYIYRGYRIPLREKQALLKEGKTSTITEWQRKDGKGSFWGELRLSKGELHFVPETVQGATCPSCSKTLYKSNNFIFCGSCDFTLWYTIAGRVFTYNELHSFLLYKHTDKLTFVSKESGKYYTASLQFSLFGEIIFDFA